MDVGILGATCGITGYVLGYLTRWLWTSLYPSAPEVPHVPASPTHPRTQVIFRYADKTRELKTLFVHSLQPRMPWRGKMFKRTGTNGNTAVYEEEIL